MRTNIHEYDFRKLKTETLRTHKLIKTLQVDAKSIINPMECVSLLTEIEVLKKSCLVDLNKLQMLGLSFMNKLQYVAVSRIIQNLKKEIE